MPSRVVVVVAVAVGGRRPHASPLCGRTASDTGGDLPSASSEARPSPPRVAAASRKLTETVAHGVLRAARDEAEYS